LEDRIRLVYVKTPARLHFGFIELSGDLGRIFGSVGLAISSPNMVLLTSFSDRLEIHGVDTTRIEEFTIRFLENHSLPRGCRVEVRRSIPIHVGLGSGTQTALAVARSLSEIYCVHALPSDLAITMDRVSVSSVGLLAFERGGFVIDAGYKTDSNGKTKVKRNVLPPVVFRHDFPENWLFVIAIPSVKRGLSGEEEKKAFEDLSDIPEEQVGKTYRTIYGQMVPSLIEKDIRAFGKSLTQLQVQTGRCFESVQGGIYSSTIVEACVRFMLQMGAYGAGQSSWGPTTYGLVYGWNQAKKLLTQIQGFLEASTGGDAFIVSGNNKGALIRRFLEKTT
jgi:beta-ribofuranosylaminobenzene 5'-phosphate synthase